MYLLYYLIAMLAPLLISQILLWVIYGFKGIPFRLMLTRKILAFVFAFIASLCVIYIIAHWGYSFYGFSPCFNFYTL